MDKSDIEKVVDLGVQTATEYRKRTDLKLEVRIESVKYALELLINDWNMKQGEVKK